MLFFVETVLLVALACPEYTREGVSMVSFFSTPVSRLLGKDEFTTLGYQASALIQIRGDSLEVAIAKDFSAVPQVCHVLSEKTLDGFSILVTLEEYDRSTRERIFDKELAIMDAFPEINFDFNLVAALGRSAYEIATGNQVLYSRTD